MSRYRVLTMDGGGIRGLFTARILERLEKALPGFLDEVHLFAGTSTGGLLAVGLAAGMKPRELRQLYQVCAERIFGGTSAGQEIWLNIKQLVSARYGYKGLQEVLVEKFQEQTLAELKKKVLIVTFDLDDEGKSPDKLRTWKMKLFENYDHPGGDGDQTVVDVALRTSVAPTFFPVYQGYMDGGVGATNPAMCALAQALEKNTGKQQLENVRLLSMGTGFNPHFLPTLDADWGLVQWAPRIVNVMLEASSGLVNYQCRQLMDSNYYRVDEQLPRPIELGEYKYNNELMKVADDYNIKPVVDWLKNCFLQE